MHVSLDHRGNSLLHSRRVSLPVVQLAPLAGGAGRRRRIVAIAAGTPSSDSNGTSNQKPQPPLGLATTFSTISSSYLKPVVPGASGAAGPMTKVHFWLHFKTSYGQCVKLVGSHPKLGSWIHSQGVELRWAEGDIWTAAVQLPAGGVYEYKYLVVDFNTKQPITWQGGGNAILAVDMSEKEVDVHDNWGNDPGAKVRSEEGSMTRENKLQKWASNLVSQYQLAMRQNEQLATAAQEGVAMKGEVARLKMELGLMQQARREREEQLSGLREQNARLQQELLLSKRELKTTFADALRLLETDEEIDEVVPIVVSTPAAKAAAAKATDSKTSTDAAAPSTSSSMSTGVGGAHGTPTGAASGDGAASKGVNAGAGGMAAGTSSSSSSTASSRDDGVDRNAVNGSRVEAAAASGSPGLDSGRSAAGGGGSREDSAGTSGSDRNEGPLAGGSPSVQHGVDTAPMNGAFSTAAHLPPSASSSGAPGVAPTGAAWQAGRASPAGSNGEAVASSNGGLGANDASRRSGMEGGSGGGGVLSGSGAANSNGNGKASSVVA